MRQCKRPDCQKAAWHNSDYCAGHVPSHWSTYKARWAPNKIPGRNDEERAAAAAAAIIAPNAEAMRKELAKRRL